jgi:hypothetical protein
VIQPEQEDQEFNSWLVCAAALFGGVYLIGGICGAVFGMSFILDMDILLAIILLPMTAVALFCSIVGLLTGVTMRDIWLLIPTAGPFLPLAFLTFIIYAVFIRPMII